MKKHCFYTSFNKAYASQALLLAKSLRHHHGDKINIQALIVDEVSLEDRQFFSAFDEILFAKNLNIPNFEHWIYGLDIVEAATAVKPFGLCHLLREFHHVTYLDPDILVYSTLDELFTNHIKWDVALTPHQIMPQQERWVIEATELESLRFGIYNLGFLSVRATANGKKVANWWRDRCYDYCISEPERGLFTDQKMFDAVPAMFDGVHILRHPGYNVATWNIRERDVNLVNDQAIVNGQPLRFCHFTKATHIGNDALERMVGQDTLFEELFYAYVAELSQQNKTMEFMDTKWFYGYYKNGQAIEKPDRNKFRSMRDKRFEYRNPFEGGSEWVLSDAI
ncbi:MAG: hypothetical protein ACOY3Z_09145 [Thermodesulfobacteriota bacterium]